MVVPDNVERRIADATLVAQLGTCVDGTPHIAHLWYRYDDGNIEIVTTGQKLANIRRNPSVVLGIHSADDDGMPEWHASLFGTATIVEDDEESRAGRHRIHRKYGIDEDAFPENQLVRIEIVRVSFEEF